MDHTSESPLGDLKGRTKQFALNIIKTVEGLPPSQTSAVLGKQLLRAGTSVGANYRAACRSRSRADFISKITVVEEETDEYSYWLELLHELHLIGYAQFEALTSESNELTAIFVSSSKTAKANARRN
jgi:four helix bundle protein